tara:strand:+ start:8294 stop:9331 length:1038 start_codon:yes stop_codon:yes gene_type:complete
MVLGQVVNQAKQTIGNIASSLSVDQLAGQMQGGILRYPYEAMTESTDYLQVDVLEYRPIGKGKTGELITRPGGRNNTLNNRLGWTSIGGLSSRVLKNTGTILLQIPSNIQDSNDVDYGSSSLNGLSAAGAKAFQDVATGDFATAEGREKMKSNVGDTLKKVTNDIGGMDGAADILTKQLAARAVNTFGGNISGNQLLARSEGSIMNPNMELLFNGPKLRNFRFSFKMTPRNAQESEQIKLIIRTFKRNMAPKTKTATSNKGNFFIKTPNVFELRYRSGNQDHPFLHKFKQCFLTNVSVNYTSDGVYATYEDATPISMQLDLEFKELEPIYDVDYDSDTGMGGVGY